MYTVKYFTIIIFQLHYIYTIGILYHQVLFSDVVAQRKVHHCSLLNNV